MFLTRTNYQSPVTAMFAGNDEQMWEATEIPLQKIWFLVSFQLKDEGGNWLTSTLLVSNFELLEPFLQSGGDDNTLLDSVNIVTPAHVNGAGDWHMERLIAVWQGQEMIGGDAIPIEIFETVSGKMYPAAFCGVSVEELVAGSTLKYQLLKQ